MADNTSYENPGIQIPLSRKPEKIASDNRTMPAFQQTGSTVDLNRTVFSGPGSADFKSGKYQNPGAMAGLGKSPQKGAGPAGNTPMAPEPWVKGGKGRKK